MSTVAVRKTTYDGLNAVQKAIVGAVAARLQLGQPAVYTAPGGALWLCFDDDRISLTDLAILGTVAANLAALANFVTTHADGSGMSGAEIRQAIQAWAAGKVKLPDSIDYTGQTNPWQYTLTQQGAPASVQADSAVPAGWTPQAGP